MLGAIFRTTQAIHDRNPDPLLRKGLSINRIHPALIKGSKVGVKIRGRLLQITGRTQDFDHQKTVEHFIRRLAERNEATSLRLGYLCDVRIQDRKTLSWGIVPRETSRGFHK